MPVNRKFNQLYLSFPEVKFQQPTKIGLFRHIRTQTIHKKSYFTHIK